MPAPRYFAEYARFSAKDKSDGAMLAGSDNIVGDDYKVDFRSSEDGPDEMAWLVNRFGKDAGCFDAKTSHDLALCKARGWQTHALLASVWYSETPKPGVFWGEMVVMCYPDDLAPQFDAFRKGVSRMLADGARPDVGLDGQAVDQVVASNGAWRPTGRVDKLKKTGRSVLLKDHETNEDKLIEKARSRNVGCIVGGWAALLAVVAVVVVVLKSCAG